jgi:hypothetical protein
MNEVIRNSRLKEVPFADAPLPSTMSQAKQADKARAGAFARKREAPGARAQSPRERALSF